MTGRQSRDPASAQDTGRLSHGGTGALATDVSAERPEGKGRTDRSTGDFAVAAGLMQYWYPGTTISLRGADQAVTVTIDSGMAVRHRARVRDPKVRGTDDVFMVGSPSRTEKGGAVRNATCHIRSFAGRGCSVRLRRPADIPRSKERVPQARDVA